MIIADFCADNPDLQKCMHLFFYAYISDFFSSSLILPHIGHTCMNESNLKMFQRAISIRRVYIAHINVLTLLNQPWMNKLLYQYNQFKYVVSSFFIHTFSAAYIFSICMHISFWLRITTRVKKNPQYLEAENWLPSIY